MKRARFLLIGSMVALFVTAVSPLLGQDTRGITVRPLIQRAFEQNDRLEALRQTARSARDKIDPAGTLEDPRLQAGVMNLPNDSLNFTDEPMTSKDLALMQKLPYPGTLDHRQKQALAEYRAARAGVFIYRARLADQVRSTYYDWWSTRRLRAIAREEQKQLERLLSIARSRYETGDGIQADFQRASTRISRLDNRLLTLEQREEKHRERLNRLLGYASDTVSFVPVGIEPDRRVNPRPALGRIEETSPVLRRDTELVLAARHGVRLAGLDFYPDADVGVRYRQREDRVDFVSFSVTLPLPLWSSSKQTPRFQSKQHQLRATRSRYRDDRDQLQYSFEKAYSRLRRIRRQLELYDERLLPEARKTLESTLSAYRVGRVDFVSVLDAELELYTIREERIQMITDHQKTLSELARIAGYERMEDLP